MVVRYSSVIRDEAPGSGGAGSTRRAERGDKDKDRPAGGATYQIPAKRAGRTQKPQQSKGTKNEEASSTPEAGEATTTSPVETNHSTEHKVP